MPWSGNAVIGLVTITTGFCSDPVQQKHYSQLWISRMTFVPKSSFKLRVLDFELWYEL